MEADGGDHADDELRPDYELDYSKAKPNRFAADQPSRRHGQSNLETSAQKVVKLVVIAVPCALICCAVLSYFVWWNQSREAEKEAQRIGRWTPDLVAAPSAADQSKMIAAMKAHPNPPFNPDLFPPLGSDASGLGTLFAAMNSWKNLDGSVTYELKLRAAPNDHPLDVTTVTFEVGGNPPRVIRRLYATTFTP